MRARKEMTMAIAFLLAVFVVAPAWAGNVNKSVTIGDGKTSDGASSVNGSIRVGDDAVVSGSVTTVNGTIRVGSNARVEEVETVNGSLRIGDGVHSEDLSSVNGSIQVGAKVSVVGEVTVVNGRITLEKGTTVSRSVHNVNGDIELSGANVAGDLKTVTGDVRLEDNAVLQGDLIVEKPHRWNRGHKRRKPVITIGPGSRVEGTIQLEYEVELFISDTAEVGEVSGVMNFDDAIRFSGKRP